MSIFSITKAVAIRGGAAALNFLQTHPLIATGMAVIAGEHLITHAVEWNQDNTLEKNIIQITSSNGKEYTVDISKVPIESENDVFVQKMLVFGICGCLLGVFTCQII